MLALWLGSCSIIASVTITCEALPWLRLRPLVVWGGDLNLGTPVSRPRVLTSGKPPMSLSLSQCHTYVRTLFAEWHCCGHAEFSIIWKTMCKTICRTSTCVLLLVNRVLQWWHRYISLCTIIRCVAIRFFKLGPSIRIFVDKHLNYTWGDHLETPVAI